MSLTNSLIRQYDPANVKLTLGGVSPTDVAPDTMYALSKEEDLIIPSVGVRGEVALAVNRNNMGTLTISLKQTSPMNETFMKWGTAIKVQDAIKFFNIYLEDPASGIIMQSVGWVQTQPDFSLGKEISQLDWVIGVANIEYEFKAGVNTVIDLIKESTVL